VVDSRHRPNDPHRWRRFLMLRRHERLKAAGIWWSVYDLFDAIDNSAMPFGLRLPNDTRWDDQFLNGLENGFFGRGRHYRVLLLDPEKPVQRVTAENARHILETSGLAAFRRYVNLSYVRIDDAHDWLRTWFDDWFIDQWLSNPSIREALRTARLLRWRTSRLVRDAEWPMLRVTNEPPFDPGSGLPPEDAKTKDLKRWISEFVAHNQAHYTMPTREAAFRQALQAFPEINRHWFDQIYRPPLIPEKWIQRGRWPGARSTKGRDRK
jgi:hypothetical protein